MYKPGQYVFYLTHGVAKVSRVERKTIGDKAKEFYVLNIVDNSMTILCPVSDTTAIRPLVSEAKAKQVIEFLSDGVVAVSDTTWNRRYREFMELIKTGQIDDIAHVYRALTTLKRSKDLSFGERKMLELAEHLLSSELSLVVGQTGPVSWNNASR